MEKIINISVPTPSKTWESIRNKLIINDFIATEKVDCISQVSGINKNKNKNMNFIDNFELNRVDYN